MIIPRFRCMIASLALIVSGIIFVVCGGLDFYRAKDAMAAPLGNKVILLDPGHGGIDAGATANEAVEKELNLQIAMYLKSYIEGNGGICYMTRIEDVNTADPNRGKGISQKMSDLKMRKKNIDDYNADVFISIHMNKFSQPQYSGLQVFYDGGSEKSKLLGESIQETVKLVLNDGNTRKAKATGDKIYVLKGNEVPSALVECGFLSNADEAERLKTPEYQRKVAWGIYIGIINFFNR